MKFLYSICLVLSLCDCIVLGELRGKDNRDYYFRNFLQEIRKSTIDYGATIVNSLNLLLFHIAPDVIIEMSLSMSMPDPNPDPVPAPNPVPPISPPTPAAPVAPPIPASPIAPPASVPSVTPPTPVSDDLIAQNIDLPEADCPCLFPDSDKRCCYLPDWACKPGEKSCSDLLPDLPIVPVCGCDGKTYLNPCIALVENCLHCWTYGPCVPDPPVPPTPPLPPTPPAPVPPEPPVAASMPWITSTPTAPAAPIAVPPTKVSPRGPRTVF